MRSRGRSHFINAGIAGQGGCQWWELGVEEGGLAIAYPVEKILQRVDFRVIQKGVVQQQG